MFDRHTLELHAGPQHTTVHEHRAPTDASVALLRDMERAAREQVLQAVRVENCPVECVIHKQVDPVADQTLFLVLLRINGKRVEVKTALGGFEVTPAQAAEALVAAVGRAIAAEVLAGPFAAAMRRF